MCCSHRDGRCHELLQLAAQQTLPSPRRPSLSGVRGIVRVRVRVRGRGMGKGRGLVTVRVRVRVDCNYDNGNHKTRGHPPERHNILLDPIWLHSKAGAGRSNIDVLCGIINVVTESMVKYWLHSKAGVGRSNIEHPRAWDPVYKQAPYSCQHRVLQQRKGSVQHIRTVQMVVVGDRRVPAIPSAHSVHSAGWGRAHG